MAAGFLKKIPFARPLAIGAGAFALYLLLGFFAAPPLVKRILTHNVAETLKRAISVGEVRVNPLTLAVELKDFALTEKTGEPIAAFRRLYVDFQLSSLGRFAWTFSEIGLEGLDLRADIAPGGRFNLLALLEDLPKSESRPGAKPPRVLLQHVLVSGGAVNFSDRSIPTPASAKLAPLDLEVNDLSTLPDREGRYAINVRLPGGGIASWRGDASLQPLASDGEISVKGMKPATAWSFIGHRYAALEEPRGEFDVGAKYRFSYGAGAAQLAVEDIKAGGKGIAIATRGDKNVSIALDSLELPAARAEFTAAQGKPWQAKLEIPKASAGGLEYVDRTRLTPLRALIKDATLGFSVSVQQAAEGARTKVEKLSLTVNQLSASEAAAQQPLGVLEAIAVEGGSIDVAGNLLAIERVAVRGGELRVERDKDGKLPILNLLAPSDAGAIRRELGAAAKEGRTEGKPWRATLGELAIDGTRVALADHSFGAPVAYDVRDLKLSARGIDTDDKLPLKFDASLSLAQGGRITASGDARLSGREANLRVKVERVSMKPVQPALATRAHVVLASGEFSADLKSAYRRTGDTHGLKLGGTLRVDNLLVNEKASGERLIAWTTLTASGLSLGLAPNQLRIEDARLNGLGAKIVVFQDRSTNITKALVVQPAEAGKAAVTTSDTEALFPIVVERVRIEGAAVDFADLSLVLPFGAKVNQAGGLVEGISTDRKSRASLKFEGRVDEYGLARAEGALAPFHPTSFMDIGVQFRNVDMPALSPYSATFAGRRIASGKLSLDLKYKINEGKLAGDNRVVLEKFTLGERVESPTAINLPLDLAIAILTDSDGKIDLAVPVTGDVNDPQFSYGPLIWQAIRTVIGKIVTAPFRALASLFGGGSGENLEAVAFDPGRAALLPPEQEKLKSIAEGLAKRPQLKLVAEGQTGPTDKAALQQRDVALAVGAKLGRAPAASTTTGTDPDPVNVADAKTQRALEAVFAERQSEEALTKFAADTAKARGKEVERANAALALVGRASADRAFYEALLKRLNETANVPDAALVQLADARARAVTAHLTGKLGFPAERASARASKSADGAQVRLELDAAK